MLSVRIPFLSIHGQIFNHVEVSTQYGLMFWCGITFLFVKEDFQLGEGGRYIGHVCICYLKFVFWCFHSNRYYMACLIRLFKFHFKVFEFLAKYWYSAFCTIEWWKKSGTYPIFFPINNVFISTVCFLKKYNIKFRVAKSLENPFSFLVVLKTLDIYWRNF